MKPNTKIVRCQVCKQKVGAPGLVLHMRKHEREGTITHKPSNYIVPKHPIDSLENTIRELIAKESDIHFRLTELKELESELKELSRLRGNLEIMVEQYRKERNEETPQIAEASTGT